MLKKLSGLVFVIGLLAVIVLSVMPAEAIPKLGFPEILAHIAGYAALTGAGGIAFRDAKSLILLAAGLILLGIGLELVQKLVPGRDSSGLEMLANIVGIALGCAAAIAVNFVLKRRR